MIGFVVTGGVVMELVVMGGVVTGFVVVEPPDVPPVVVCGGNEGGTVEGEVLLGPVVFWISTELV